MTSEHESVVLLCHNNQTLAWLSYSATAAPKANTHTVAASLRGNGGSGQKGGGGLSSSSYSRRCSSTLRQSLDRQIERGRSWGSVCVCVYVLSLSLSSGFESERERERERAPGTALGDLA